MKNAMDENFLELLGNSLITMARTKKQGDETVTAFRDWFASGAGFPFEIPASGMELLSDHFLKSPGPGSTGDDRDRNAMLEEALSNFQDAFAANIDALGFVPRDRHLELVEKYEALKSRYNEQKETVDNLRMLLKSGEPEAAAFNPNHIVRNQQDLFQEMMKNFGDFLSGDGDPAR